MKIFSSHRKKLEPHRRFGTRSFQNKVKLAASYKRAFNPTSHFSLKFMPSSGRLAKSLVLGGIVLILALGYFFFISPAFLVTNVSVSGNVQVSNQQIQDVLSENANSRFMMVKKNDFFLMTEKSVTNLLTKNIPTIKTVRLTRHWPNKATIEISEHTPGFVIESGGQYFLVDDAGVVVSQIDDPKKLLVAHDSLTENFAQGESLPSTSLAPFILSMNKSWSTKMSVPLASAQFSGKSDPNVQFATVAGWTVFFDTTRPVTVQLSDLAVMLSKQISATDQLNLVYIDLRLSKWAYYCFKASPCEQGAQPATAGTETNTDTPTTDTPASNTPTDVKK